MSFIVPIKPFLKITVTEWLRRLGLIGTVLSLAILTASAVLRLTTIIDAQGYALSQLVPEVESAVRMMHRISATLVALIALAVLILSWRLLKSNIKVMKPALWIACSVLILSIAGPLTNGYRHGFVTVINVVIGMVMLMSFWWLSESLFHIIHRSHQIPVEAKVSPSLVTLAVHIASGAGASAWFMYGMRWPTWVHVFTLFPLLAFAAIKPSSYCQSKASYLFIASLVVGLQFISGVTLLWQEQRSLGFSVLHAITSYLLTLMFVSVIFRSNRERSHSS
jgi:uncharacterized membrane protein